MWLSAVSAVALATNSTDTSTAAAPIENEAAGQQAATTTTSRPDLHLSLSPGTIGGLAAAGALVLMIVVSCMVFVSCLCVYQVCTCFD